MLQNDCVISYNHVKPNGTCFSSTIGEALDGQTVPIKTSDGTSIGFARLVDCADGVYADTTFVSDAIKKLIDSNSVSLGYRADEIVMDGNNITDMRINSISLMLHEEVE